MTKTIVNNINNVYKYKEIILTTLITGIAISGFAYVYLLHSAITNVVARGDIVKQNRSLSTKVSELETRYFLVKNTINIELAHAKGFQEAQTSFISKKSITAMANHHEL
ncbi:MAG: hypothetical protein Q7S72_01520 [Candidatus Taylorbacteria bacterium]|nr:hypothetical protein [Candidatus Taylorbacteria bacterium]